MKLFAFDIDGTLIPKETYHVPEGTVRILCKLKEEGKIIVLASGRHHSMINPELTEIGIDYYISCCGGYIIDDEERILYVNEFPGIIKEELEKEIWNCRGSLEYRYPKGTDIICGADVLYEYAKKFLSEEQMQEISSYAPNHNELPMSALCFIPISCRERLISQFSSLEFRRAGIDGFYDVTVMGTNKGTALSELCSQLKLDLRDTVGFGDDFNDISMIQCTGIGIAMGNAVTELKQVADYVTTDCNHGGIELAVKNLNLLS